MSMRSLIVTFGLIFAAIGYGGVAGCTRGGSGITDCEEERTRCDGVCVDTSEDPNNCGGCGVVCASDESCSGGTCTSSCSQGWTPCGPNPTDCVDLSTDPDHCGACGVSCGAQVCDLGVCSDSCSSGSTACSGQCVDTDSDPENCGACGVACNLLNATAACAGGHCAVGSCDAGFDDCDGDPANGCEVELSTDDLNCGQCGNVCAAGIACGSGECQSPGVLCGGVTCPAPQLCCRSGGGMGGGTTNCYDPASQECSGSVLECDGASDCASGEVCCRDYAVDPLAATCTSACLDTVLCSQSADCPGSAPYCCPFGGMVTTNICDPNPC